MFRLKELRFDAGLTRADLARALNINQGTLANYENETRQADYETLLKIAEYFGESVDYLLGRDEVLQTSGTFRPLSKNEKDIINKYRDLSADSRDVVWGVLTRLSELESK